MKGSLIILFFFCSGVLLARLGLIPTYLLEHDCTVYALWLLMLLVGIDEALKFLLIAKAALVPLAAIARRSSSSRWMQWAWIARGPRSPKWA